MKFHKCNCKFVPPSVLENLAKAGIDAARLSIQQSEVSREKRKDRARRGNSDLIQIRSKAAKAILAKAAPVAPPATGTSRREVYDSQQTFLQRVALVRAEGDPSTADADVQAAYDYAGVVRDWFKKVVNRDSIDNRFLDLILNVHYGVQYMNAFWDGDEMTFGDGDGNIFVSFAKSLDVVAHELAHGVTQYTANLDYFSQSGALNESFSDVFGSVITQYFNKQTAHQADWLIGDEIMGPTLFGEALRSMKAPGTAYNNSLMGQDPQPEHMDNYYPGPNDNQGVHINSGIPNKAFYLVATAIDTDKAALIWYSALQKLWSTANFADAVQVIVEAARILTKAGQVPLGSTQTVRSAFRAVGL